MNLSTTIIGKTCETAIQGNSFMGTIFEIAKSQVLLLLVVFIVVPFLILLIYRGKILNLNKAKKREIIDKMIISYILMMIVQLILYLFMVAYDFKVIALIKAFFGEV